MRAPYAVHPWCSHPPLPLASVCPVYHMANETLLIHTPSSAFQLNTDPGVWVLTQRTENAVEVVTEDVAIVIVDSTVCSDFSSFIWQWDLISVLTVQNFSRIVGLHEEKVCELSML